MPTQVWVSIKRHTQLSCRGPVTLCPSFFFRRTYHHHHHNPQTNSSFSGQNQAPWNDEVQGLSHKIHEAILAPLTRGQQEADGELQSACYDGGLVGGSAAQQELRQLCYLQSPSQRDVRKVESEVGRSVKDDAKHGARAGGWQLVRVRATGSGFVTPTV